MRLAAKLILVANRPPRREIALDASLRIDDVPIEILIEDVSVGGFRAQIPGDIDPEASVIVGTPSLGVREARIIWRNGDRYGFEFRHPIRASDVSNAQSVDNVVTLAGSMERPPTMVPPFPEPVVGKWPGAVRLSIVFGGLLLSWLVLIFTLRHMKQGLVRGNVRRPHRIPSFGLASSRSQMRAIAEHFGRSGPTLKR